MKRFYGFGDIGVVWSENKKREGMELILECCGRVLERV